jgi:hypothetical protein
VPKTLSLRRHGLADPEGVTGDPVFDAEVRMSWAPDEWILAVLDAQTRERVRELIRPLGFFRLSQGRLERETPGDPVFDADRLRGYLRNAVAVAHAFNLPARGGLRESLARNAREDPLEEVRSRCLKVLCASVSDPVFVESVCREALSDRSPRIRFEAARALGERGVPALEELIQLRGCPDDVARAALERLVSLGLSREVVLPHLLALLDSDQASARRLAIETLGRMLHVPAIERLVSLLGEANSETAVAVAHALGRMGDATVVPRLTAAMEAHPHDRALCEALREAVRAIQSRLVGADAGQLSLPEAPGAAGDLSLADAAEDERGRLSLGTGQGAQTDDAAAEQGQGSGKGGARLRAPAASG